MTASDTLNMQELDLPDVASLLEMIDRHVDRSNVWSARLCRNHYLFPPVWAVADLHCENPMTPHIWRYHFVQVLPAIPKPLPMLPPGRGDEMEWDIRPIKRYPHDDTFIRMREHLPGDFLSYYNGRW